MARPTKETVDYFPHYTNGLRKTIDIIQSEYGNDGYAFWFKLLEFLCNQKGLVYSAGNPADLKYLAAKTHVSVEKAELILNSLAELDAIDKELWQEKIIWSDNLVENVKDAFKKRTNVMPQKPDIIVSGTGNPANDTINPNFEGNPAEEIHEREREREREREIKLNEIKEKEKEKDISSGNSLSQSLDTQAIDLCKYYEQLKPGESISSQLPALKVLIDMYGFDWTKEALQVTVSNKNEFIKSYIEKVLKNWKAEGHTVTPKAKPKAPKIKRNSNNSFGNYSNQRQYDTEKLRKQLLGRGDPETDEGEDSNDKNTE